MFVLCVLLFDLVSIDRLCKKTMYFGGVRRWKNRIEGIINGLGDPPGLFSQKTIEKTRKHQKKTDKNKKKTEKPRKPQAKNTTTKEKTKKIHQKNVYIGGWGGESGES